MRPNHEGPSVTDSAIEATGAERSLSLTDILAEAERRLLVERACLTPPEVLALQALSDERLGDLSCGSGKSSRAFGDSPCSPIVPAARSSASATGTRRSIWTPPKRQYRTLDGAQPKPEGPPGTRRSNASRSHSTPSFADVPTRSFARRPGSQAQSARNEGRLEALPLVRRGDMAGSLVEAEVIRSAAFALDQNLPQPAAAGALGKSYRNDPDDPRPLQLTCPGTL